MKRLEALAVAAALITGCASSPSDLRGGDGIRGDMPSSKAPREATQCLARNIENYSPLGFRAGHTASWRENGPGTFEVTVPNMVMGGYLLIADIAPREGGSQITTWLKSTSIVEMDRAIVAGCE